MFHKMAWPKVAILSLVSGLLLFFVPDYRKARDYTVLVTAKMVIPGGAKSSGRLIVALKTEDGNEFEQNVGLPFYSRAEVGKSYVMRLRPADIKQTRSDNMLFVVLPVLLVSLAFGIWFSGTVDKALRPLFPDVT